MVNSPLGNPAIIPARDASHPPATLARSDCGPGSVAGGSVGFISLGCAKNLVDSQIMAGVLLSEDITLAPSPEEADVIIVNTCAFIDEARKEAAETIKSACALKEKGICKAVLVTGCLPQRYKHLLREEFPGVDGFMGLDELEEVGNIVRKLVRGERGIIRVYGAARKLFEPKIPALSFTGGPFAYLKIAEGCNHHCSFCAIPAIRGHYRSRPVERIVKEAGQLLEHGFKELNLISQDVTEYGSDLGGGTDISSLIRALGRLDGKFWIRLLYGHPSGVTDKLMETMLDIPQICRYLDIPIQHSHPEILRAMGREETAGRLPEIIAHIRKSMPDAVLRTTCLVGFPGETEKHFENLLEFIKATEFDHVGVFVFSPEEHTRAFGMAGRPAAELAEERRQSILLAQKEIMDKKASALIGTEAEVLLEMARPDDDNLIIGRSGRYAPEVDGCIFVEGACKEDIGKFIKVKYTEQLDYDMKAVRRAEVNS